ncbi:hypothetical protein SEA_POLLYWOG_54 [Mycobacterium phage Pollywog]|nr:hypothetical protein SEA_POLLYWOG_54 [Mycobacterium phage Pollywog]
MNLVERLNARFNNVIHDGLALVGAVVDPWLAKLERQAMNNALGRDFGLDYGDCLAAVEAEEEVHEPRIAHVRGTGGGGGGGMSPLQDRVNVGGTVFETRDAFAIELLKLDPDAYFQITRLCLPKAKREAAIVAAIERARSSAGHRVSADQSPVSVGDIGPGAGMVPPPPAPGPSNGWDELHKQVGPNSPKRIHDAIDSTKQYCLSFAREFLDDDEFMELGEFLDTATAEELAAMRRQREVSTTELRDLIHAVWHHTGADWDLVAGALRDNYSITPR